MPLVGTHDLSVELDSNVETIRRLYRAGVITGYRVGRHLKFDPAEVREELRDRRGEQPGKRTATTPDFDALDEVA